MERRGSSPFRQVLEILPSGLKEDLEKLGPREENTVEELRLRVGQPVTGVFPRGEWDLTGGRGRRIGEGDLRQVLEIATGASVHTALAQVRSGFVTIPGGHRVGLCGTAVVKEGAVSAFRHLSSLNIRVARAIPEASREIRGALTKEGLFVSTLILSPPGFGKTTLLRDLVRSISDGVGMPPARVGVADERGEIAAMYEGVPQMDVGRHTDVMDGCPKAAGLLMLLRSMGPQVLAADEITAPEDCSALISAANCGVKLLSSAHAGSLEELEDRPIYRLLLEQHIFRRFVVIERTGERRRYRVEEME